MNKLDDVMPLLDPKEVGTHATKVCLAVAQGLEVEEFLRRIIAMLTAQRAQDVRGVVAWLREREGSLCNCGGVLESMLNEEARDDG